jgi:hypothetical protein
MPRGARPRFSPDDDAAIEDLYRAGATLEEIAARYGVSPTPVGRALRRRGVERRVYRPPTRWDGTPEQRREVLRLHGAGVSVGDIERAFHVGPPVVSVVLREAGVQLRPGGKKPRFDGEQATEIGRLYTDEGLSLTALAKRYATNPVTIRNTLARLGIERRTIGRPEIWTAERIAWMAEQYGAGRSQQDIADELSVNQTAVSARLITAGVITRTRQRREDHHSWKGGRVIDGSGYIRVKPAETDRQFGTLGNGYVLEHRLVMARALGRPLVKGETVHHINGDRADNRLSNLQLRQGQHGNGIVIACLDCGSHNVGPVPIG